MNIIAVDDERRALKTLEQKIRGVVPDAEVNSFTSAENALEYAKKTWVDVAFLDIQMGKMSGLSLAKHLKDIYGSTNIIFVTAYSQYTGEAIRLRASGYITKPVNSEHIREELDNLRNPVKPQDKGVRVQCFGNFEIFTDGAPLKFFRSKTKELLAYLVSRQGALCDNNEIIAAIWQDEQDTDSLKTYFRQLVADLNKTLQAAAIHDILIKRHNALAVIPDKFNCDFYDFCNGKNVNNYKGEFMAQYSWAELINSYLDHTNQ